MSTEKTVERKAETKNSISRLVFVAISILLEIGVFLIIITKLNEYAQWINIATRIFALILVLIIYGQNKTSAMKMPWIMLNMAFPSMISVRTSKESARFGSVRKIPIIRSRCIISIPIRGIILH